jgi:2-polyprenyl-3-methyl-5-hydroxy-6-metoxy-1,4-benzoquinol methylase
MPSHEYFELLRPEIFNLVPTDTKLLLDLGCGFGALGAEVSSKYGARCYGIESNPEAESLLSKNLFKHWIGDVEDFDFNTIDIKFDCIVLADVLEHLVEPWLLLGRVQELLTKDGIVIVSIPNIRNLNVLASLIFKGRWEYRDSGILDRTHLRFFTNYEMKSMFIKSGFEILSEKSNRDCYPLRRKIFSLIPNLLIPDLRVSQFIFTLGKVNLPT